MGFFFINLKYCVIRMCQSFSFQKLNFILQFSQSLIWKRQKFLDYQIKVADNFLMFNHKLKRFLYFSQYSEIKLSSITKRYNVKTKTIVVRNNKHYTFKGFKPKTTKESGQNIKFNTFHWSTKNHHLLILLEMESFDQ